MGCGCMYEIQKSVKKKYKKPKGKRKHKKK